MADALERFFNWQSDMDWYWGPLLYLRPSRNVRMTLRFWLKLFGLTILFMAPIGAVLGTLLAYYDYTTAQHHEAKSAPIVATENWVSSTSYRDVLFPCYFVLAIAFLWLFLTHRAWNRRADRLNREPRLPQPVAAAVPGVWPPPPTVSGDDGLGT
jgi:hypothetical protein